MALVGGAACREDSPASFELVRAPADASTARETGAAPVELGGLKIASLNVHRLFDTTCDSGACAPGDYEEAPSPSAFAAKVTDLTTGISRLDAQLVLVQEVETKGCLDALAAKLPKLPYGYLAETGAPASVDVGLLSAFPITETRSHRDPIPLPNGDPTTFARDLLEAHIASPEGELVVFVAHFRSKVNDDPDRRLAEARAARRIVVDAAASHPNAIVLLGGDLNDVPGSPPLEALAEGGLLLRVSEGLPTSEIGTIHYGGGMLAIDHFFLARSTVGKSVQGSFQVFRDTTSGFAGSDHGAIRANFTR